MVGHQGCVSIVSIVPQQAEAVSMSTAVAPLARQIEEQARHDSAFAQLSAV
jgi:hypothetical protein